MVDARQGIPGVVLSQSCRICIIFYLLPCCQGRERLAGTLCPRVSISITEYGVLALSSSTGPFSHRAARARAGRASHETDIRRPGDAGPTKRFVSCIDGHRHPPLISPGLAPVPMSRPHKLRDGIFGLVVPFFAFTLLTPESDQQLGGRTRLDE